MGILNRLFGKKNSGPVQSNLDQKAEVRNSPQSNRLTISPSLVSGIGFVYVGMGLTEDTKKLLGEQTPDAYQSINPEFSRELLKIKSDMRVIHSFCSTREEGLDLITKQGHNVAIQTRDIKIAGTATKNNTQVPITLLIATWFTKPKSGDKLSIIVLSDDIIPE